MKLQTMKLVDKYAGCAACFLLTLWEKIVSRLGLSKKRKPIKKAIAVMKFWGMGSIILSTPLVKALRERYPTASVKIIFVTLERNRALLESLNLVDEIYTIDVDRGWLRFFLSLAKCVLDIRRSSPDAICDLEFFTRFSAIVSYLSGAPTRAGYHSFSVWRGDLHNIRVPFNRYWHVVDNFYNIGRALGIPYEGDKIIPPLAIPTIKDEDRIYVENILSGFTSDGASVLKNRGMVIMHANASDLALERRWPYKHFAALSEMIIKKSPSACIIFIGTKDEYDSVEEIRRNISMEDSQRRVFNLAGRLNIRQLAYLFFKMCDFAVCNDSGPLHLAVACGAKTVSIFGPETPVIYGPYSKDKNNHIVFFRGVDCSPCVNVHDGKTVRCARNHPECLAGITPEEVFNAISLRGWI